MTKCTPSVSIAFHSALSYQSSVEPEIAQSRGVARLAAMSSVKAKLKDIQKHLKAEEYDEVIDLGKQVLKEEKGATQNVYHA